MYEVLVTVLNGDLEEFNAIVERYDLSLNCVVMNIALQRYEVHTNNADAAMMIKLRWGGK